MIKVNKISYDALKGENVIIQIYNGVYYQAKEVNGEIYSTLRTMTAMPGPKDRFIKIS